MLKKLYTILILSLSPILGYSQADCIVFYKYVGILERVEISDSSKIIVDVPESGFFENFETTETTRSRIELEPNQDKFEKGFRSHLSSIFCRPKQELIEAVFKGKNKLYPFILNSGSSNKKIELEIDRINFHAKSDSTIGYIEINLGILKW